MTVHVGHVTSDTKPSIFFLNVSLKTWAWRAQLQYCRIYSIFVYVYVQVQVCV